MTITRSYNIYVHNKILNTHRTNITRYWIYITRYRVLIPKLSNMHHKILNIHQKIWKYTALSNITSQDIECIHHKIFYIHTYIHLKIMNLYITIYWTNDSRFTDFWISITKLSNIQRFTCHKQTSYGLSHLFNWFKWY